jgi:hypothetical protein
MIEHRSKSVYARYPTVNFRGVYFYRPVIGTASTETQARILAVSLASKVLPFITVELFEPIITLELSLMNTGLLVARFPIVSEKYHRLSSTIHKILERCDVSI